MQPSLNFVTPLFPSNPPLKVEVLSNPLFWKFGWRFNPLPHAEMRGGGCPLWSIWVKFQAKLKWKMYSSFEGTWGISYKKLQDTATSSFLFSILAVLHELLYTSSADIILLQFFCIYILHSTLLKKKDFHNNFSCFKGFIQTPSSPS